MSVTSTVEELFSFFSAPQTASVEGLSKVIDEEYKQGGVLRLRALDSGLRSRGKGRWGTDIISISPDQVELLYKRKVGSRLMGVISGVRNGRSREQAVRCLSKMHDERALCALLIRVNDPSYWVSSLAREVIIERLDLAYIHHFVYCLPLLSMLNTRKYSSQHRENTELKRKIEELFQTKSTSVFSALTLGIQSVDAAVRLKACMLMMEEFQDKPEECIKSLKTLFSDPNPSNRFAAARIVEKTSSYIASQLLPLMWKDRSQAVRTTAIHMAERMDETEYLVAGAFDRHGNVRYYARKFLYERGFRIPYREKALEILQRESAKNRLLGALATLSEFGRQQDLPLIRNFLQDDRSSIVKEGQRTEEWIQFSSS